MLVISNHISVKILDQKPTVTCEAKNSRPAGRFRWYIGREKEDEVENSNPPAITPKEHGFVDMAQEFTFEPRPDFNGKLLFCEYIQVRVSC